MIRGGHPAGPRADTPPRPRRAASGRRSWSPSRRPAKARRRVTIHTRAAWGVGAACRCLSGPLRARPREAARWPAPAGAGKTAGRAWMETGTAGPSRTLGVLLLAPRSLTMFSERGRPTRSTTHLDRADEPSCLCRTSCPAAIGVEIDPAPEPRARAPGRRRRSGDLHQQDFFRPNFPPGETSTPHARGSPRGSEWPRARGLSRSNMATGQRRVMIRGANGRTTPATSGWCPAARGRAGEEFTRPCPGRAWRRPLHLPPKVVPMRLSGVGITSQTQARRGRRPFHRHHVAGVGPRSAGSSPV